MEKIPGHQPGNMQMFPNQLNHPNHPGPRPEGPSGAFPGGSAQQRQSTLAQLQMQVEKLAQHPNRQPPPNHWSWYPNVRLPGPHPPRPMQGGSPSQTHPGMAPQGRRYSAPQPNTRSPTAMMQNTGFPPQVSVLTVCARGKTVSHSCLSEICEMLFPLDFESNDQLPQLFQFPT